MNKDWCRYCLNPRKVLTNNSVEFIPSAEKFFPVIMSAIKSARRYILMEFYIFADDAVGRMFSDILKQKSREGVKVFIIYDAVGSLETSESFFDDMRRAQIKVREYHPVEPWKPHWNLFKRNHKKALCVDGEISFLGGFNINIDSAPKSMGGKGWKDSGIKLSGEVAVEIAKNFADSWAACGGKKYEIAFPPPRKEKGVPAELLYASGFRSRFSIRRSYKHAIRKAEESVFIINAYFLPDRLIYRRLLKAAKKGVSVKIIVPSKTDHPYVKWASMTLYPALIKSGVEIYEWQGEVLHSKTAVIDGMFSSVGSHNLDHRSLYYNLEMNVSVYDREFGQAVTGSFFEDLKHCRKLTIADCKNRRFLAKAAGRILYWFKGLL